MFLRTMSVEGPLEASPDARSTARSRGTYGMIRPLPDCAFRCESVSTSWYLVPGIYEQQNLVLYVPGTIYSYDRVDSRKSESAGGVSTLAHGHVAQDEAAPCMFYTLHRKLSSSTSHE